MDVCTAAKKKGRKKKQMMKLEIPRVFSTQHFLQPVILSPFGVSHSRGNAVKSFVRMRNEAKERPFPSLLHSLFFSLSFFFREKLAHDAKFRDFIDRKVSPVPSVS